MPSQSFQKSLQGGSSKHHHSHDGHNSHHGSSGGKDRETQATEWYWVWACHSCCRSSDMSTDLITHCVECNHLRCEDCPLEAKKNKSRKSGR
jgi:hypothetical protein